MMLKTFAEQMAQVKTRILHRLAYVMHVGSTADLRSVCRSTRVVTCRYVREAKHVRYTLTCQPGPCTLNSKPNTVNRIRNPQTRRPECYTLNPKS